MSQQVAVEMATGRRLAWCLLAISESPDLHPPISPECPSDVHKTQSTRLNQWAHWARAQGPRIFFLFEGPPTGCGEIFFETNYLIVDATA